MSIYQRTSRNSAPAQKSAEALGEITVEVACLQGAKGDKGDKGDTPNISAASQTLPAGSAASVSRSGTNENPVFTFGIPKGDKGDKGEKGERGEQGESAVTAVENSFIANLF